MWEIDQTDMIGLLRVRLWDAKRKVVAQKPKRRFIDNVWPDPDRAKARPRQ